MVLMSWAALLVIMCLFKVTQRKIIAATCVASIGGACPPAWTQWGVRCYKVTANQTHTWQEAKQTCLTMGGQMVVPRSDDETEFLKYLQPKMWIGCNDLQTNGVWVCQEGTTNVDYRNWNSREPDNFQGKEHCVAIKRCGGGWADVPCSEQYAAVCTRPVLPALHL